MSSTNHNQQRRRGKALEEALFDAAWEELHDVGYAQFTFEGVANRAGTSKTVLYRRWGNRVELVHALLRKRHALVSDFIPDTKSFRNDVIALLEHMVMGMDEFRTSIQTGLLIDTLSDDSQRAYVRDQITKSNLEIMKRTVEKARERHEKITLHIQDRVLILPFTLVRHELILTGKAPTKLVIREIVDDIFMPLVTEAES